MREPMQLRSTTRRSITPMVLATLAALLPAASGSVARAIEAAYLPAEGGGGEYVVRVEPDLVRNGLAHPLTSDLPTDARDVRRVRIYVADAWPPTVERAVGEAARRPRPAATLAAASLPVASAASIEPASAGPSATAAVAQSWPLLIGSLLALFTSLGANAYLGLLLAGMRQRYQRDLREGLVQAG
ncbi:MAG: hypothetical protein EBR86_01880 [Planctomycetia bacterium]|nr:hypothetical protein [Planctomycetia bacterium]